MATDMASFHSDLALHTCRVLASCCAVGADLLKQGCALPIGDCVVRIAWAAGMRSRMKASGNPLSAAVYLHALATAPCVRCHAPGSSAREAEVSGRLHVGTSAIAALPEPCRKQGGVHLEGDGGSEAKAAA